MYAQIKAQMYQFKQQQSEPRALLQLTDMSYLHPTARSLYAVSGAWAVAFTKHSKLHLVSVTPWATLSRVLKRLGYCSSSAVNGRKQQTSLEVEQKILLANFREKGTWQILRHHPITVRHFTSTDLANSNQSNFKLPSFREEEVRRRKRKEGGRSVVTALDPVWSQLLWGLRQWGMSDHMAFMCSGHPLAGILVVPLSW